MSKQHWRSEDQKKRVGIQEGISGQRIGIKGGHFKIGGAKKPKQSISFVGYTKDVMFPGVGFLFGSRRKIKSKRAGGGVARGKASPNSEIRRDWKNHLRAESQKTTSKRTKEKGDPQLRMIRKSSQV